MTSGEERVQEAGGPAGSRPRGRLKLLLGVVTLAALAIAAIYLPTGEWLGAFLDFSRGLGVWGLVLFIPLYVVATVLFVPGLLLTLGAGFLFGLVKGTIVVSIGSTLGVAAAFLVGRYVARSRIESTLASRPKFRAIDAAVGREGFKIVLLTRLSPVFPFNLLNYAYGVTRVRFRDYFLASWIGMLPGTIMYVYFGTIAGSLAEIVAGKAGPSPFQRYAILGVGLVIAVVVTVLVTRVARRALSDAIEETESS
ncbi:MAG: TVP38/TMEM64 family protein [Acidobacteriota bacterium]|nr:TVP38/TMEM64 family protein [Acidobacteriota bacterium]